MSAWRPSRSQLSRPQRRLVLPPPRIGGPHDALAAQLPFPARGHLLRLLLPIIRIERVRPRREHDPGPDLVIGRQSRQNSLPSGSAITMKPAATLLLKRPPSAPRPAAWRRPDVEVDATLGDLALGQGFMF